MNRAVADIWNWILNYIEQPHEFYDNKFAPCPYARAARMKGLVDVVAYNSGSVTEFIQQQTDSLIDSGLNTRVMVFPAKMRWYYHVHWFIKKLNRKLIGQDFYIQYGRAVNTQSTYDELLSNSPYFIVIVNKLSDVLAGHRALLSTRYYDPWSEKHYREVVIRRDKFREKYAKTD